MSDLMELLERVKAATGPDRYVDCHLWVLAQGGDARMHVCDSSMQDFVWERGIDGFWVRDVVKFRVVPKYTASIDAALALVERKLPGWQWCLNRHGAPMALVNNGPGGQFECERAATMPLAILAALLSALTSGASS